MQLERKMRRTKPNIVEPGLASPLDAAVTMRDRGTMAMVEQALSRGDVRLAFQPVVQSDSGRPAFYEGLIRLIDDTGRVIPARDFIGAVEDKDIGRQIDCASLQLGLRALRTNPSLRLSINMSARSVGYPPWMNMLKKFTRQHPDAVQRLILEITESSVMMMPELVAIFMEDLQDKGVTFALDDFGAGYTAFRHLKTFCFDILKIDGQFSRGIDQDPDNQVLMEALLSLGRHFDMLVVAESVETGAESAWLRQLGVDCQQGYYFAVPAINPPWKADPVAQRA
jgi:EAL domain-containing protein (putative c-di-GMP-specific phosphodiesterase class I)